MCMGVRMHVCEDDAVSLSTVDDALSLSPVENAKACERLQLEAEASEGWGLSTTPATACMSVRGHDAATITNMK